MHSHCPLSVCQTPHGMTALTPPPPIRHRQSCSQHCLRLLSASSSVVGCHRSIDINVPVINSLSHRPSSPCALIAAAIYFSVTHLPSFRMNECCIWERAERLAVDGDGQRLCCIEFRMSFSSSVKASIPLVFASTAFSDLNCTSMVARVPGFILSINTQ